MSNLGRSDERTDITVRSAMTWIQEYIKNVYSEMQKVSWPSRDELVSSTLVTLVATVIVSALIYAADQVISTTLAFIYG